MSDLRFAVMGTGFWAPFQLAGWNEVGGARCTAVYNRTRFKAQQFALRFGIDGVYENARTMLEKETVDFVDIITDVVTHSQFVHLAAEFKLPVICQKPLATSLDEAQEMADACRHAGVPLYVHENFRWQTPMRVLSGVLASGQIGEVFRARIRFASSFPVFDNQPALKQLRQFILTDVGTHILDTARFLFGEAASVYCTIQRVDPTIAGEDVATVVLAMRSGATVICELSYASCTEDERFPETYVWAEGQQGSVVLGPDYWVRITTPAGIHARRYPPARYTWADPAYDVVHASIAECNRDLLAALRNESAAETTVEDNLKTLKLVYASYESAESKQVVNL